MTASAYYKGYTMIPAGFEVIMVESGQGYSRPEQRMSYNIVKPNGEGLGKAWSMAEARAIINEDIAGRL